MYGHIFGWNLFVYAFLRILCGACDSLRWLRIELAQYNCLRAIPSQKPTPNDRPCVVFHLLSRHRWGHHLTQPRIFRHHSSDNRRRSSLAPVQTHSEHVDSSFIESSRACSAFDLFGITSHLRVNTLKRDAFYRHTHSVQKCWRWRLVNCVNLRKSQNPSQ